MRTLTGAAFLVSLAIIGACAPQVRSANTAPLPADKLAELWQAPEDISGRDLFHGTGGTDSVPRADAAYSWVSTDTTGFSSGYEVRDSDGRVWDVKLGIEAQTELVASRVLWALGYHQPAMHYVHTWTLSGGPGGPQQAGRFRLDAPDADSVGDWSWADNEFIGTQPYHGLIVANILMNSWDWKTTNNKIYRVQSGASQPQQRYMVRDLGASFGKTEPSRLLWVLPFHMRGFGQGTRNDIAGFESQGFIKKVDESGVDFHFHTIYGGVVDLVRPSDVRWTVQLMSRLTDSQWDDAFRAAGYAPEVRERFVRKIKAKIAEGLAVS